jgi:hypothetical protein
MPAFNAAPLLNNPDFKVPGGFTIRKYTITEDANGIGVKSFEDVHAEGAIVPSGSLGMERTAETERQGSGITVYTETPISTGDASIGQPADDVIWNNLLWQVVSQDDYSIWGFNVAEAIMQDPGGRPIA